MQFSVHRFVRTKVVVVSSLVLSLLVVPGFSVGHARAPHPAHGGAQQVAAPKKPLEQRKRDITKYLAARYKKQQKVVRMYVDLAFHEAKNNPAVSPELILAVIQKETSLGHTKRSSYGAEGPMQVVRRFHTEKLSRNESLMNPKVNLRVGTQILQEYIAKHGALAPALVKYSGNAQGYAEFVLREKRVLQAI